MYVPLQNGAIIGQLNYPSVFLGQPIPLPNAALGLSPFPQQVAYCYPVIRYPFFGKLIFSDLGVRFLPPSAISWFCPSTPMTAFLGNPFAGNSVDGEQNENSGQTKSTTLALTSSLINSAISASITATTQSASVTTTPQQNDCGIGTDNSTEESDNALSSDSENNGAEIPTGSCGKTLYDPLPNQRIIGGDMAKPRSIPWIVRLYVATVQGRGGYCGGTLLRVSKNANASDIVLTAAHCHVANLSLENSKAMAGSLTPGKGPDAQTVNFAAFVDHENYTGSSSDFYNDIAIIKLAKPIEFGPATQPACLPPAGQILDDDTPAMVAGWGGIDENATQSDRLRQVKVPVFNHELCKKTYSTIIKKQQVCVGTKNVSMGSCPGDSGGPLLVKLGNHYTLQGLVSYGAGCRTNFLKVYTRVSNYVCWIKQKIQELSDLADK